MEKLYIEINENTVDEVCSLLEELGYKPDEPWNTINKDGSDCVYTYYDGTYGLYYHDSEDPGRGYKVTTLEKLRQMVEQ